VTMCVALPLTASRDTYFDIDPLGLARQRRQEASNVFLIDVAKKLLAAENFIELGKRRKG
jgi:hypothetical protein